MEKSLSYPGKLADADIKISRRCPAGNQRSLFRAKRRRESNAEILKKASRSSAKLKEAFMLKKRGFYVKEKGLLSLTKEFFYMLT